MLISAFGWSWEYVDEEMTLPRMAAILNHWELTPPVAVSLAGIAASLGVKMEPKKSAAENASELQELLGVPGIVAGRPEWLTRTE